MHEIPSPDQIKSRIAALGLTPNRLAGAAGVHHTTLSRIFSGKNGGVQLDTMIKLGEALAKREIELRDYLLALHPVETHKLEAAE